MGFNHDAWVEQELTNDRAALHAALERRSPRVAPYTRLGLAVTVGAATGGPDCRPADSKVIFLLTEGLKTVAPPVQRAPGWAAKRRVLLGPLPLGSSPAARPSRTAAPDRHSRRGRW